VLRYIDKFDECHVLAHLPHLCTPILQVLSDVDWSIANAFKLSFNETSQSMYL
jgi:hypothetical protein